MAKLYHNVYQKSKLLIVFSLIFHYNIKYLERSGNMFFICMLMPASISILIEKRIDKTNKSTSDLILKYLLYTFLITMVMNTFVYIFSSEKMFHYAEYTFSYDFCLKYMWLSLVVAIILPYILKVISTNVDIKLELKEKKDTKKDKAVKNVKKIKEVKKRKNNKSN